MPTGLPTPYSFKKSFLDRHMEVEFGPKAAPVEICRAAFAFSREMAVKI